MTVRNFTPFSRETLSGERRPIHGPGGEWLNEFPRPSIIPRICHFVLSFAALIGFIAVVVAAVSVAVR